MVIYLDVLFCLNAIGTLFQLLAAQLLCKRPVKAWRTAAVCVLGGVGAAAVFFAPQTAFISLSAQILGSLGLCAAAFAPCPPRVFVRVTGVFLVAGMLYTGTASAAWYLLEPGALTMQNGAIYFDVSPLLLIGSTLGCYLILTLMTRLCARQPERRPFSVEIVRGTKTAVVRAIVDTGCSLTEPVSGCDAAVVFLQAVSCLLTAEERLFFADPLAYPDAAPPDVRLIPASTVAGGTLLPAFRPDEIRLHLPGKTATVSKTPYIAVCTQRLSDDYDALLGAHVLNGQ